MGDGDAWVCKCGEWSWWQKKACHRCGGAKPANAKRVPRPSSARRAKEGKGDTKGRDDRTDPRHGKGKGGDKGDKGDNAAGGTRRQSASRVRRGRSPSLGARGRRLDEREADLDEREAKLAQRERDASAGRKEVHFDLEESDEEDEGMDGGTQTPTGDGEGGPTIPQLQAAITALEALPNSEAHAKPYKEQLAKLQQAKAARASAAKPLWVLERRFLDKRGRKERFIAKAQGRMEQVAATQKELADEAKVLQAKVESAQQEIVQIDEELRCINVQRLTAGDDSVAAKLERLPMAVRQAPEIARLDKLFSSVVDVAASAAQTRMQRGGSGTGARPREEAATPAELQAGNTLVEAERQFTDLFTEFLSRFQQVQHVSEEASNELSGLQLARDRQAQQAAAGTASAAPGAGTAAVPPPPPGSGPPIGPVGGGSADGDAAGVGGA